MINAAGGPQHYRSSQQRGVGCETDSFVFTSAQPPELEGVVGVGDVHPDGIFVKVTIEPSGMGSYLRVHSETGDIIDAGHVRFAKLGERVLGGIWWNTQDEPGLVIDERAQNSGSWTLMRRDA